MSRDLIAWALALKNSGSMINPMQSLNDLIIGGNDGTPTRLSTTGNNKYLHTNASTGNIEWVDTVLANVNWGNITGTLANQIDLKDALDNKQATIDSNNKLSADLVDDASTTNKFVTTQTAYTSKGSATKVPQITTNTLGQVTGITEVNIDLPNKTNRLEVNNITGLTNAQCEALQIGDIVVDSSSKVHSLYVVSFKNTDPSPTMGLLDINGIAENDFTCKIYRKTNLVWEYDSIEGSPIYDDQNVMKLYRISISDVTDISGTVYTFTDELKEEVLYGSKILVIPGALLNPNDTNIYFYYPNTVPDNFSTFTYTTHEINGYIYSLTFYVDDQDDDKLKLDIATGFIDFKVQSELTTSLTTDTLSTVIGFNSNGDLVKGSVSGGATVQDLTSNTAGTLDATAWGNLKTTHSATISSPTMTGLDSTYSFVDIKLSINSVNQIVKLTKNTTSKYSGLFFIEESTNLFEITVYYNSTNIILRCATVY